MPNKEEIIGCFDCSHVNCENRNQDVLAPSWCPLTKKEEDNKVIVRLSTSIWKSNRGGHIKRDIIFLKRKSSGFNFLEEDFDSVGVSETIERIINLNECTDGIYEVVTCNISREYESGIIDDWDYKLIKL